MARVVGAKTAADREIPTATLARLHTPWERTQADAATQAEKKEPLRGARWTNQESPGGRPLDATPPRRR